MAIWKDESPVEIAIEKLSRSQPPAATRLSSNGGPTSFQDRPIPWPRTNLDFKDVLKYPLKEFKRFRLHTEYEFNGFKMIMFYFKR